MTNKQISSIDYWISVGLYMTMVEVMRTFNKCRDELMKRFPDNERIADEIVDASTGEGSDKSTFDTILKSNDVVVFDNPVEKEKSNE